MTNDGKRCYCRCMKAMTMSIGKKENVIFVCHEVYPCQVRINDHQKNYYKIYGQEFALSCNENEFKEYFQILTHDTYK